VNVPDLRRLADLHDERPTFLSLFLDLRGGVHEPFLRRRQREIESALAGRREELDNFRQALAAAFSAIPAGRTSGGIAVFSNPRLAFFELFEAPGDVEDRMVVDSSPYIKPLVALQHEWEEYLVVVLDHTHARIFVVAHYEILDKDEVAEEIVRHHRHGGMSQMRFQRLHAGYVDHYFKEVAEHLVKEVDRCSCLGRLRGIVLAGPKDAKTEFEKYLPPELERLVLGKVDEPADVPDGTLVRTAEGLVEARGKVLEGEMMERLRGEILKGGLATYGFEPVHEAVARGRADILVLQAGFSLAGWRCEHCRNFGAGAPPKCPVCGKEALFVDAVEELVELALDMRTQVEFQPDTSGIRELGGVAALLRY
jgi:peptide chain release factor subunit 1